MSTGNSAGKQSPSRVGAALCVQIFSGFLLLVLQALCLPAAQAEPSVSEQLDRIERRGNFQAQDSVQELGVLQSRLAPGSREQLHLLCLKGSLLARLREEDQLSTLLAQLADWPDAASKPQANLVSHLLKARRLAMLGQLEPAKKEMAGLAAYTPPSTPLPLLINAYQLLGRLQSDTGQIELALASLHMALKLAESSGSNWRRANTQIDLADAYVQAMQFERAEQTVAEALKDVERDPDPTLLYAVHTMRGIVYAELGRIQLAGQAKQEALRVARQSELPDRIALALANYADFHLKQGNYPEALKHAEESLPLARKEKDLSTESVALANMGLAKIALKRTAEGKRDVLASTEIELKRGALSGAALGFHELGTYLEKAGDLAGSVEAYHQHRKLIDQVLREETLKAVLEAQANYDDERRDKELQLLNRDMSLKNEQLLARNLQLKLWAALAGCVVLFGVLMVLAYQRIRKTNESLAHSNAALRKQSERDPLTGLSNRRHFQAAIKRLADQGKLSGTVFLIDIDHFKRINDVHGHAAGDTVLVDIAKRLRATLREDDLVVRWGGEEFLIVVETTDPNYANVLAQRLLDQIGEQPVTHGALHIAITASIGFATFPVAPHGLALSWERAIDLVDTVMYMAKAHGRNKAYGIESIEASDEATLLALAGRMEAAWHEGSVQLRALSGPVCPAIACEAAVPA
ncbi:diguanylate cyclase [Paucibacter sp. Y2R2-4]|uniref:tetratricopeptide repeat-containing diguanylate cyclase n=1 Tax=Paucibacter sp. Y2R2-4 TaxID=2893553 RepID=UPI0021E42AFA|nr:diguanylate cyclase [Paucibacter sp. Y2R2-4]MCV2351685.1 diguanylate cyclase [Paucibacter sp. Y2R2-4]